MRTLRAELLVRSDRSRDEAQWACVPVGRARAVGKQRPGARAQRALVRAPKACLPVTSPQATATPRLGSVGPVARVPLHVARYAALGQRAPRGARAVHTSRAHAARRI